MHLVYEDTKEEIIAIKRKSKHQPPHLHNALEVVYVTKGSLEMGVGESFFHMEEGDIGIIFPHLIHHYQVLSRDFCEAVYINAPGFIVGKFEEVLKTKTPVCPVLKASELSSEVKRAIETMMETDYQELLVVQAYLQIILARCIPLFTLENKRNVGSDDIIYRTVSYVAANFKEAFSLEDMARDLGVSKFNLSRVFSKTFHSNFNQYINEIRLRYACSRLENTNDTITEICLDSGFESQRTFNRVFKERYKVSPSEYRKKNTELFQDWYSSTIKNSE